MFDLLADVGRYTEDPKIDAAAVQTHGHTRAVHILVHISARMPHGPHTRDAATGSSLSPGADMDRVPERMRNSFRTDVDRVLQPMSDRVPERMSDRSGPSRQVLRVVLHVLTVSDAFVHQVRTGASANTARLCILHPYKSRAPVQTARLRIPRVHKYREPVSTRHNNNDNNNNKYREPGKYPAQ